MSETADRCSEHSDPCIVETLELAKHISRSGVCLYEAAHMGAHITERVGHKEKEELEAFLIGVQALLYFASQEPPKNQAPPNNVTPLWPSEPGLTGFSIDQLHVSTHLWADPYNGDKHLVEYLTVTARNNAGLTTRAERIICHDPLMGTEVILSLNGNDFVRAEALFNPVLRALPDASFDSLQ